MKWATRVIWKTNLQNCSRLDAFAPLATDAITLCQSNNSMTIMITMMIMMIIIKHYDYVDDSNSIIFTQMIDFRSLSLKTIGKTNAIKIVGKLKSDFIATFR